jgi:hypothetical protein
VYVTGDATETIMISYTVVDVPIMVAPCCHLRKLSTPSFIGAITSNFSDLSIKNGAVNFTAFRESIAYQSSTAFGEEARVTWTTSADEVAKTAVNVTDEP